MGGRRGSETVGSSITAFTKRECSKFIPSHKDTSRCSCGAGFYSHQAKGVEISNKPGEIWGPTKHTLASPTDAYGTIDFLGGPHPNKAQYIRLGFDSRTDLVLSLLTREWGLELPKLLISVHGGKANFDLSPRLKKVLRKGLLKAAKTTGAWLLTGGLNTGVTRHVGDALVSERSPRLRGGRVVSIGVAPWGVVENRGSLVNSVAGTGAATTGGTPGGGGPGAVPYLAIDQPRSKLAVLNPRHAYFLLVDNGTVGRYGAEIALRRRLEKYISSQRLSSRTYCSIPIVCLVIEGGMNTIRTVIEYVTDSPPVPVVVVEGSGRAADLLAFAHRYMGENGDSSLLESLKDQLVATLERTFHIDQPTALKLFSELVECVRKKNLITVFRLSGAGMDAGSGLLASLGCPTESHTEAELLEHGDYAGQELDAAILSALFRSRHLSAPEQLSLALAWNRVDMARSEIFVYGQEWPNGALDEAMMDALVKNRVEFVQLLLEQGVTMAKFLTIPRLEELYNSKQGPANTLRYLVRDVRPHMPRGYDYTLVDIGLVINKLMGGAFRSNYTRRKFRLLYYRTMKRRLLPNPSHAIMRVYSSHVLRRNNSTIEASLPAESSEEPIFPMPFNELFVWAVLTKRAAMAALMWSHGEEALAKALVACKLYGAMAREAAEDDLEVEIYNELRTCATEFETRALELLDYCYRQDDDLTGQLLTCQLTNWSGQTCLGLAFACQHRSLIAHPCAQLILADLWMGGLRTRRSTNLKVLLSLFFPPLILYLEFKSKEELQLMPQTEEEHLFELQEHRHRQEIHLASSSAASSNTALDDDREEFGMLSHKISMDANDEHNHSHSNLKRLDRSFSRESANGTSDAHGKDPEASRLMGQEESSKLPDGSDFVPSESKKRSKQLTMKQKFYEFYTAPITKFWGHSLAFLVFLMIYTYTVLVKLPAAPEWNEYFIMAYIATFGGECLREIVVSEPVLLHQKFFLWLSSRWNACDALALIQFFIGVGLRLDPSTFSTGRVFYCLNIVFWYIRILRILGVSKFLGPFVTMMGKMVKNMIYFIVILAVILMSYGVFRQSLLFPNEEPHWQLARHIFFQPYFMIYGEVFAEDIDPPCGGEKEVECVPGRFLNPLLMSAFLLMANILSINLMIAMFNSIFIKTNAISHQVWRFQRFSVVMEYEQKPTLPPPIIIFSHLYLLFKCCRRRARGLQDHYDHGLKLFLDPYDLERLYDFEEECMEGLAREKEMRIAHSTEERVRLVQERVESHASKLEDVWQKETTQTSALQALEFRLLRLEEATEQTAHIVMNLQRLLIPESSTLPTADPPMTASEIESVDKTDAGALPPIADSTIPRMRITRSSSEDVRTSRLVEKKLDLPLLAPDDVSMGLQLEDWAMLRRLYARSSRPRLPSDASQESYWVECPSRSSPTEGEEDNPLTFSAALPAEETSSVDGEAADQSGARARVQPPAQPMVPPMIQVLPPSPPKKATLQQTKEYSSFGDSPVRTNFLCLRTPQHHHLPRPRPFSDSSFEMDLLQLESEVLRDAEGQDYFLMEEVIARRLRRDSENLDASLEDLNAGPLPSPIASPVAPTARLRNRGTPSRSATVRSSFPGVGRAPGLSVVTTQSCPNSTTHGCLTRSNKHTDEQEVIQSAVGTL